MSRRALDMPSLVAGLVVLVVGGLLLLDRVDVLELRFSVLAPVVLAACGAVLLAAGLDGQDRGGPDGT